ncbi:MAG: S-layer homology domain-containing protein, partial [Chloroflexota bacterium]|nr:S-layer homology domain-containing protein [Chloroflexota bacterium]
MKTLNNVTRMSRVQWKFIAVLLTGLLAVALLGSSGPVAAQTAAPQAPAVAGCPGGQCFEDMPASSPFFAFVNDLFYADIIGGYACGGAGEPCVAPDNRPYYRPAAGVTRAQMTKFVDLGRSRPGVAISTTNETTPWDTLPLSSMMGVPGGTAFLGANTASTGTSAAVVGRNDSSAALATGVEGIISATSSGGNSAAVRGLNYGTTVNGVGVWGTQSGHGWGVYGESLLTGLGVYGKSGGDGTGVLGDVLNSGTGVYGINRSTTGVGKGVIGESDSGLGGYGVYGKSIGFGYGVYGESNGGFGVYGKLSSPDTAGDAIHGYGLPVAGNRKAGNFEGNVTITGGTCTGCTMSTYQIDDPRDPANKIISQAAVASPDYMNIYNGTVTTGADGLATVQLPSYFGVLNRDARYQLTVIGQFAQAIVAEKVKGNSFVIKTDKPNVEVSWQVTGIRNDAVARANP